MEDKGSVHVIFGTGALGLSLAEQLTLQGKKVRLINRSGKWPVANPDPQWEIAAADAADPVSAASACRGAEAVYHCMGLPYSEWKDLMPKMMAGLIEAAAAAGAKLIYGDNLYAYGPVSGKLHEGLPYNPIGDKTEIRAITADLVMDADRNGTIRAAIGRAPDFYGPRVTVASLGAAVFENAGKGKPIPLLGNPDLAHTYIYIKDFAKGLAVLGEQPAALGQIWHIPSAETMTTRQLLDMVAEGAGSQPLKYRRAGKRMVGFLGLFNPMMRELKEMMYQFEQPFIVDHSKFESEFGALATPHRAAVQQTQHWLQSRGRPV